MADEKFYELQERIHSLRFSIMQNYMFLYGGELKGHNCKMDLFAADALNELEEEKVMNAIMEMEVEEDILGGLKLRYQHEVLRRNQEMIVKLENMKKGS